MESVQEQLLTRTEYVVGLRRASQYDANKKKILTGDLYFYLAISGKKGAISLPKESIFDLSQALKDISSGKIPITNDKPCVINPEFVINGFKRFKFDEQGLRKRIGTIYLVIKNPSNRQVIMDASLIDRIVSDLDGIQKPVEKHIKKEKK